MRLNGAQVTELRVTPELQKKWDDKLSRAQPLAPRDLQGQLTQGEYDIFSNEFDKFCERYVVSELQLMNADLGVGSLTDYSVAVLGSGLGRGLGFIPSAIDLGMKINLYDLSLKALEFSKRRLNKLPKSVRKLVRDNTYFHHEQIQGLEGQVGYDSKLIVMSQFLQILPPCIMRAVMKSCAENLRQCFDCRIVIIHRVDNHVDDIPGDTRRYTEADLLTPLREGLYNEPIEITRRSKIFPYFNYHDYRAITIARL
jgi:hypothetical protein